VTAPVVVRTPEVIVQPAVGVAYVTEPEVVPPELVRVREVPKLPEVDVTVSDDWFAFPISKFDVALTDA
jgi:hypothetical protein